MKWFFAGLTVFSLFPVVIPDSGLPGWVRVIAAVLALLFASGAFAIWAIERDDQKNRP